MSLTVQDSAEVTRNWESKKAAKRKSAGEHKSALAGIPKSLPALAKAELIGKRVATIGFDWPNLQEMTEKVSEELEEFLEASRNHETASGIGEPAAGAADTDATDTGATNTREHQREELGDLLFTLAQLARQLGFSAEELLQEGCQKFSTRYLEVERLLEQHEADGKLVSEKPSRELLESFWQRAKELTKKQD